MPKLTRNQMLYFSMNMLFNPGMVFLSINIVFSYFLFQMGAPTFVLGLLGALAPLASLLAQPVFLRLSQKSPLKAKAFIRYLYAQRFILLGFVLLIPALYRVSAAVLVGFFVAVWTVFNVFVGSYTVFSIPLYKKTIPVYAYGKQQGIGSFLGQITGLLATLAVGKILSGIALPYNYMLLFGLGGTLLLGEATLFWFLKEEPGDISEESQKSTNGLLAAYSDFGRQLPRVFRRDRKYYSLVLGNMMMVASGAALPFCTQHMVRSFGAGGAQVGMLTTLSVVLGMSGAFLSGILSDRIGHSRMLIFSGLMMSVAGCVLFFVQSVLAVYIGYGVAYVSTLVYMVSCYANIIRYAPEAHLPAYVSINTLLTLSASSLCSLLYSFLISVFHSFLPIFFAVALMGMTAMLTYFRFFKK